LTKQIAEPGIEAFAWQEHYGMFTFSERSLESVVHYIEQQADHHARNELWLPYELTSEATQTQSRREEGPSPVTKGY
jgi:hypothetical protein